MAETIRSKADLLTLFADNVTEDVSAADLRDLVESLHPQFGSISVSAALETTIANPDEWTKLAGTTVAGVLRGFSMPSAGRLQYDGTPDIHTHLAASLSMTAAGNNKVTAFAIAKNGTVIASSEVRRKIGTGSDIGSTAVHADILASTGDYLELYAKNVTDSTNLTLDYAYLFALGMFR
jgi:hypothetical protein